MNLMVQAATDLRKIIEDTDNGFSVFATVDGPSVVDKSAILKGIYRNVNIEIDVGTGELVNTNVASIAFSIPALAEAGLSEIRNATDSSMKPWTITLVDLSGATRDFKVSDTNVDQLGCLVCMLEKYERI